FYAFSSVEIAGPQTSGVAVRRSALLRQEEWFAEGQAVGEDLDLWFRLLASGRAAYIDAPLYAYRQHPASLMRNTIRMLRGSITTHERNYHRCAERLDAPSRNTYRARLARLQYELGYQ